MSNFNVPTREEVSANNQELFDTLKKKLGKVPNLFATMAHSKNGLGNYLNLNNAPSSLSLKEREVINLAVSQTNECAYCLAAHTFIAKLNGFTEAQILEIRTGSVSFDKKLNALSALSKSFVINNGKADANLLDDFFAQGYTKENLVDAILTISDKIFTNYLYAVAQVPVDFPAAPALEPATA